MENPVLTEIKDFAIKKLQECYGYCGVAEGGKVILINSDDKNGNDITIKIEIKKED